MENLCSGIYFIIQIFALVPCPSELSPNFTREQSLGHSHALADAIKHPHSHLLSANHARRKTGLVKYLIHAGIVRYQRDFNPTSKNIHHPPARFRSFIL